MMSQHQQLPQQTVVIDAGPVVTSDGKDPTCNYQASVRPIITRTVATPLATPRGSPAAAATDNASGDVIGRDNSSDSFVTSLAGYSDTLSYEASCLALSCRLPSANSVRVVLN